MNNETNTHGIGDFLVAELNGIIRERSLKIQAELESEMSKQIASVRTMSVEFNREVARRGIQQPIADESMPELPPPAPQTPPANTSQYGDFYRGGLPKSLWGW